MTRPSPETTRFGTLLGLAPGDVPVYSCDYETVDESALPDRHSYRSELDGIYMGYKWQCVELARRWWMITRGYFFDEVAMAYEIFDLRTVRRVSDDVRLPLASFRNGSRRRPVPGALLIWDKGGEFEHTGHVAVITEVLRDRVRIVEQNYHDSVWPEGQDYSREIPLRVAYDGGCWLRCPPKEGTIIGWVLQTDDDTDAEPVVALAAGLCELREHEVPRLGQADQSWLNEANPHEAAFVEMMEGHLLVSDPRDQYRYLALSESAYQAIQRATDDLHGLFMHATDWVLQDEARLRPFNLPTALWPRLRLSWADRRNHMITGRFDLSVSQAGIKVYEYNCDSASCYMECGHVQGQWARHFGAPGADPGAHLFDRLVAAWRESEVDGVLHVMYDNDPEEAYHALYMREALAAAGVETKTLRGIQGLRWRSDGTLEDEDNVQIRWVWKTWAWETALDQIRDECTADELGLRVSGVPRLVDVLLPRAVRVFEPLWTLIPSNKAILPVLWDLFPNHPYLLESRFDLSDDLREKGYVAKPIVGRCGHNIAIYGADNTLVTQTEGSFDQRDTIYQALCRLPRVGGNHVQISSFSVAGRFAGAGARVDTSPVITSDSDLLPLRVLDDERHLRG